MNEMKFCQSCAMPMSEGMYGSEKDGSISGDYCKYCFQNGSFTADMSMDEMIEFCVPHMVANNEGMAEEAARGAMKAFFPQLKRWA